MKISLGFSFLVRNVSGDLRYIFTVPELAFMSENISNRKQFQSFTNQLSQTDWSEWLHKTFEAQEDDNFFVNSGFAMWKLVSCNIWIKK